MPAPAECPRCKSAEVKVVAYRGTTARICNTCGFDERNELDIDAGEKTNQKAKGAYSPYRTGGPKGKR